MASNQEAVKKYQTTRDAIMLRPSKEDGARIRQAAADAGMSVQGFMFKLFNEYMERHNTTTITTPADGEKGQGEK